ncbi:MAG: cytochrome b/b6 domain-containing protein [Desulforudis sp.]|nr:cytochrome b/b6 domain-containing protein [Clostridia bacterium]MDQ7791158.1 cytochrome b/b6 domain-containing protein [Clostridia bacterium]RJX17799.1 MAG: cytochrome b/b6 domain-containing protein [Desulforudis sp.]
MKSLLSLLIKGKKLRHPWPTRLLHWSYAPAVLAGILSGFYITRPSRVHGFTNMDSARKTHFIAQYVLISSYLARVYYAYSAKNYREIIPDLKDIVRMPEFLKYQLFLTSKKPKFPKYNPGQKIVYTSFALLIPVQIVTGLGLYVTKRFQKPATLAGGLNPLRKLHYLASVSISALAAGHIYFALTDSLKKLKSIFTGYK